MVRGHRVTVLVMRHLSTLPKEEVIRGVTVWRAAPLFPLGKGFLSLDWLIHSWRLVQTHDTILIHLPQFEGVILAMFGKMRRKRVVAIYHCEIQLPRGFMNGLIQKVLEFSHTLTLFLSDTVATYTEDYGTHSRILRPFLAKTTYIYPPINAPIVDKKVQKVLRSKIAPCDVVIGVAARLAAEKGIEYLLQALPIVKNQISTMIDRGGRSRGAELDHPRGGRKVKIVVAGPMAPVGEEVYKLKIMKLVRKYGDSVVFLGNLPQDEIGAFYSLLDVLVLPSINSTEAFGMVQVEAMLCGVPIVASDLPGVRVPIRETGMGIVVPVRDRLALVQAVAEIVRHPKKYIKSRQRITDIFSTDKSIQDFETLLKGS